ncbi:hypothetical protein RRG08_007722 [Elysia crispata]|uniref:Uncharacterized protein n=1 Tax=Elysia crispata TaxID=231223 RepID=A0AAE0YJ75_9GAST|nr:hypothetical protein RRG08_007722 [Elysia crispata]
MEISAEKTKLMANNTRWHQRRHQSQWRENQVDGQQHQVASTQTSKSVTRKPSGINADIKVSDEKTKLMANSTRWHQRRHQSQWRENQVDGQHYQVAQRRHQTPGGINADTKVSAEKTKLMANITRWHNADIKVSDEKTKLMANSTRWHQRRHQSQ